MMTDLTIDMQSTLSLFRRLYHHIPPLFPKDQTEAMGKTLDRLENDPAITVEEIESAMIKFGYELWPYNQAFREYLRFTEERMGEHFLIPLLSEGLRQKYADFRKLNGTLADLHSGKNAQFFTSEERIELCEKLVDLQKQIREFARQEILGTEQERYSRRIKEFGVVFDEIQSSLSELKKLADREEDHPILADEIRARVRGFEQGLCLLGPELDYDAVCSSVEFFKGRKQELNRLKGINLPVEIDFYS
jgi:hypothetical protein